MATKVDLITGFLGAGKTTLILEYARECVRRGERLGIIENDHGAINVDLMLLSRELQDQCRLEMVIGGDPDCHRRRLKTKLIAMGIDRLDRVIVEPSGVFDIEEFTDILYEEPLEHLMKTENIITVVDLSALLREEYSADGRYILGEQLSRAGMVLFTKEENLDRSAIPEGIGKLNRILSEVGCSRILREEEVMRRHEGPAGAFDWEKLLHAGSRDHAYVKRPVTENGSFASLFFFHPEFPFHKEEEIRKWAGEVFRDPELAGLARLKGFVKADDAWIMVNLTRSEAEVKRSPVGQPVLIAIGEGITQDAVGRHLGHYENEYRPE